VRANFVLSGVATGIRRNMTMTIALILSTAIALAFVGAAILADREIAHFKHDYESKLNVSIFLCQKPIVEAAPTDPCQAKYTDEEKAAVESRLNSDPLVQTVTFVSEKEAVERFRATSPPSVAKLTQVGDLPATFIVHLKDLRDDFAKFHDEYQRLDGVGGVQNQNEALRTLLNAIDGVERRLAMPREQGRKVVASNRKARHDYAILDTYEAGVALVGTEVKSLRLGRASLVDSFATIDDGEVWLRGLHIPEYTHGSWTNHEPRRNRKLLLHRDEIERLIGKTREGGLTLVPLSLYFRDGKVKLELALARGKRDYDKRQDLAKRDADREISRAYGRAAKGRVREMR
jgi:SsrA-binding protein